MKSLHYSLIAAVMLMIAAPTAMAQRAYPDPEQASQSLVNAVSQHDKSALQTVLGKNWRRYLAIDKIDQSDVDKFLEGWKSFHRIDQNGKTANLVVGTNNWVFPIPLAHGTNGWAFDIKKGADEIHTRTIGRNELSAKQAVLAYTDAQREYFQIDRNGDGAKEYAKKIISSKGKKDGLYWQTNDKEKPSPLGPNFGSVQVGHDYHGYYYRILTRQGRNASGGALNYLKKGKMVDGFALIAWPAAYGQSGVMSFMVNQDGVVFEKDLGLNTDKIARKMTSFNPDSKWKK